MHDQEPVINIHPPSTMENMDYPDSLLTPMKTGTNLDYLFSIHGGIMPGVNIMVSGDPGIGKSSVLLHMISQLQKIGKKVLFVSAEMNRLDVFKFTRRFPDFKKIPMIFMDDYDEHMDPVIVLKAVFNQGYDVILIDSMVEVIDSIADFYGVIPKRATNIFLDIIGGQNKGENEIKSYTSFLLIQQVTKGGVFVGSNRLKHMTQATMEMKFTDITKQYRYITFSKNRDGVVGEKIDFRISPKEDSIIENELIYDKPSFYVIDKKSKKGTVTKNDEPPLDLDELLSEGSEKKLIEIKL